MGGLMSITGNPDGTPMKTGVALSDVMTGLYATIGILSALNYRTQTGKGQHVDTSLLECTLSSLTNVAQYFLTSGNLAPRLGNAHSTIVPYQAFPTADGHVILAIGNDGQFRRFCDFIGHGEWADNPDFSTNAARVRHRDTIVPMIEEILVQKDTSYWVDQLAEINVPAGPVNTVEQTFDMEQVKQRDMRINMTHSATGKDIDLVGSPLKLSATPVQYNTAPPILGEHTEEILMDILGKTPQDITELRKKGILEQS